MRKVYYINRKTKEQVDLYHIARHRITSERFAVYRKDDGLMEALQMQEFTMDFYEKGSIG